MRGYRQYCGIAKALDVVGERWTLLILRDLLLGPRRFSDLHAGLPGITPNLLSARLRALTKLGAIARRPQPPPAGGQAYELTEGGRELEPALLALGRWGWRFMAKPARGDRISLGWALIALKRRFRGCPAPLTIELGTPDRVYQYRLSGGYPDVREGTPWIADLAVAGRLDAFRALFFGWDSPEHLIAAGRLTLSGNANRWWEFLGAFGIGEPDVKDAGKGRGTAAAS
jgi:DNA-binding HxlR family transcriptional regulator